MDTSGLAPPAGESDTTTIENPQPAEPPRAWYWDFNHIRLDFPPDGVSEIIVIEYWSWSGDPTSSSKPSQVVRHVGQYKQDQIIQRLHEPTPLHQGRLPTSGFQLAVVPCSQQSLPQLGSATLDAMNEVLGLPNHHHHYSSVRSGAIGLFKMPDESWRAFFLNIHYNIIGEFEMCPHPLLPLLACELTLDINVNHLERYQTTLEQMEGPTGYGVLNERQDNFLDHRMLVKDLSKARSEVHLALATLRSTQWCVAFILSRIDWVEERLTPETRARLKNANAGGHGPLDAPRALRERAEFVSSTIEHALLRGGVKERLEGQHSTLFNLITQNDSLLSTSIAQDSREITAASKRDSSSMKIIAFLTTFFLPATFRSTADPDADILLHATLRLGQSEFQPRRDAPLLGLLGPRRSAYACDDGWDRGLGSSALEEYEECGEKGENEL
ncbi:hypothetical protein BDW66DRAFT_161147 [Aspergillus desertorum]